MKFTACFLPILLLLILLQPAVKLSLPRDVTGDGIVTVQDAVAVLNYSVNLGNCNSQLLAADSTGRECYDAADALAILIKCETS